MGRAKNKIKHLFTALLLLCCLSSTLLVPMAHATGAIEVSLPVKQISSGVAAPPGEVFTYQLTPQTPNAPMPMGSDDLFSMDGNTETQITFRFHTAGIYAYTLHCITADLSGYTVDRQVYTIEVYISDDLRFSTVVEMKDNIKVPELVFEHKYQDDSTTQVPPKPRPPRPPNGGNGPKTGDFSHPALWITLIAVSATLLLLLLFIGWRGKKRKPSGRGKK